MDDETLRQAILSAVKTRGAGKTICPSEVARTLAHDWRALMPDVRRVGQIDPEADPTAKRNYRWNNGG